MFQVLGYHLEIKSNLPISRVNKEKNGVCKVKQFEHVQCLLDVNVRIWNGFDTIEVILNEWMCAKKWSFYACMSFHSIWMNAINWIVLKHHGKMLKHEMENII